MAASAPRFAEIAQGEIAAVDVEAHRVTITVISPGEPLQKTTQMSLTVDRSTKILKSGLPIELTDLHRGDLILVNYRTLNGVKVAINISVQASGLG
jgi:hypothetical protein